MPAWLQTPLLGNPLSAYLNTLGIVAIALLAAYAARRLLLTRLSRLAARTSTGVDDLLLGALHSISHREIFLLALYASSRGVQMPAPAQRVLYFLLVLAISYRALRIVQSLVGFAIRKYAQHELQDDLTGRAAMTNIERLANGVLWVVAALFVLDNLGFNVTTMVTGLGIGGIAVALAAQALLGDLFSSFAIYLDRPFRVGDAIKVGDLAGTVEQIGIKTTRVRSFEGDMLVFSNSDLTSSRIRNFGLMLERRIEFRFGVARGTPRAQLERVPALVKEVAGAVPGVRLDRAHLKRIADSSLEFEVVYFFGSGDFNPFMDAQERINLGLLDALDREGIALAFPTQEIRLHAQPAGRA